MHTILMHATHTDTGWCCWCDLLPGWTTSHGHDFSKFERFVYESVDFYVECARNDDEEYPAILNEDYRVVYDFDICGLLNYYKGILSLSGLQIITGVNQKQLAHYAAGRSKPRKQMADRIATSLRAFGEKLQGTALRLE